MTSASFFQAVPFTATFPRARLTAASAIFATIALERFAWYASLGEAAVWEHGGSGAIGNLLLASYLVHWAKDVCGSAVPEVVGTLNPLFCLGLLLVPAVAGWSNLRYRALLAGLSLASAFALLAFAGPSPGWVVGWYALATVGEALLSPLGMNHVSAAVPRRLAGMASALWLLSLAVGGKLAGVLGSLPLRTAVTASILTSLAAALVLWLALRNTKEKPNENR